MLKIALKNKLFKFKKTKLEKMGAPRYFSFELILFKRYKIILLDLGKNPSARLLWIELKIFGLGINYNFTTKDKEKTEKLETF